jgi:5'-nucleotidase (lipoprotein e(P4) family)
MKPAVILDLDETALDNSPFQGELQRTGDDWSAVKWAEWISVSSAKDTSSRFERLSVPGAAAFTRFAQDHGVDVFYITNRECPNEATRDKCPALDQTMTLMERENFARATDQAAFLFSTNGVTDKTIRRKSVADMPRHIVMLVGDDLGDFVGSPLRTDLRTHKKTEENKADLALIGEQWGRRWFVLPNPTYGSWERFESGPANETCAKPADTTPEAIIAARTACRLVKARAKDALVKGMTAQTFRVATWNLGWHVSKAELAPWIGVCSKMYVRNATTRAWEPVADGTTGATLGWAITESRATIVGNDLSVMPPCNTYQNVAHKGIAVTAAAYEKRDRQIAQLISEQVKPDVIAFQEVSGTAAVREALGDAADQYNVCSFEPKYKIQRLAFAWRKTMGSAAEACADVQAMSLPSLKPEEQVRPGFTVTLNLAGKKVRFLTVHLKSGCVSPLDKTPRILDGNSGSSDPCPILQQQVQPLEDVFEHLADGVDHFVVLGDFNRNLWHEANKVKGAEARRSDNTTDLQATRPAGVLARNLLLEVNDGAPAASKAVLLSAHCPGAADVQTTCDKSKVDVLTAAEASVLTKGSGLGCRNPVGLDQMLGSENLKDAVKSVEKVSIGALGGSKSPSPPSFPEPLLAVSDHCPTVMTLGW